jgi:hypothetical protein
MRGNDNRRDGIDQAPNGLPLSCAATDRSGCGWTEISFQNRTDLVAAQRRQLQRRVGPQSQRVLAFYSVKMR